MCCTSCMCVAMVAGSAGRAQTSSQALHGAVSCWVQWIRDVCKRCITNSCFWPTKSVSTECLTGLCASVMSNRKNICSLLKKMCPVTQLPCAQASWWPWVQPVSPGSARYNTVGDPCKTTGWCPCLLWNRDVRDAAWFCHHCSDKLFLSAVFFSFFFFSWKMPALLNVFSFSFQQFGGIKRDWNTIPTQELDIKEILCSCSRWNSNVLLWKHLY